MDAYQNLQTAKDVPNGIVTISLTDRRVAP